LAKNPYRLLLAKITEANPSFETNTRHHLAYQIHDDLVLSGFLLDLSGLERGAFYLTAFAQPLYIPHDYLFLTYGKRLERSKRWKINDQNETEVASRVLEAVQSEGCPFLEVVNSVKKLAELAEAKPGTRKNPFQWHPDDPNVIEARAYSWALVGNEGNAKRDLLYLTQKYSPNYNWEEELQGRAATVLRAMEQDKEFAQALLRGWAIQSTASLGLTSKSR
jgi:hypothetical protein